MVLRSFLDTELGFGDAANVEIQRVQIHRLRKKRGESPRPVLARFLRAVESFFRWDIVYGEKNTKCTNILNLRWSNVRERRWKRSKREDATILPQPSAKPSLSNCI